MVLIEDLDSCSDAEAGLSMRERLGILEPACNAKDNGSDILCARWSARERSPQPYAHCRDPSPTPTPSPPQYPVGPGAGPHFTLISEKGYQDDLEWPSFDDPAYLSYLGRAARRRQRRAIPRFRSKFLRTPFAEWPERPSLGIVEDELMMGFDDELKRPITVEPITPMRKYYPSRDTSPLSTGRVFDVQATTRTIGRNIEVCAQNPLFASDSKPGYIYVYTVAENTEFVKIGFTTKKVRHRMQEWTKCNRVPILLYPPEDAREELIPHAQRVEALIHAELRPYRRAFFCESCRMEHIEWFEIPAEHAITVVQKWSDWMTGTPYLPGVGMYARFLSLRAAWRRKFADPEGYLKMASLTVI